MQRARLQPWRQPPVSLTVVSQDFLHISSQFHCSLYEMKTPFASYCPGHGPRPVMDADYGSGYGRTLKGQLSFWLSPRPLMYSLGPRSLRSFLLFGPPDMVQRLLRSKTSH